MLYITLSIVVVTTQYGHCYNHPTWPDKYVLMPHAKQYRYRMKLFFYIIHLIVSIH